MKKKYKVSLIIILVFVISLSFFFYSKSLNKNETINNNSMAIYLQDENNENSYVLSSFETIPTDGYLFNATKTNELCNGATFNYNDTTNTIYVSTTKSIKCNLYFDIENVSSNSTLKKLKQAVNNNCSVTLDENNNTIGYVAGTATTNEGLCAIGDGMYGGTSYYYRGAVNNNWVKFAGIYWRIVRINGDGSIRLIYSGTTAPTASQAVIMTGTGTSIGDSTWYTSRNNMAYLGYMFTVNSTTGTTTNSSVKNIIDNWYNSTIGSNQTYASKVSTGYYCNDRQLVSCYNGCNYTRTTTSLSYFLDIPTWTYLSTQTANLGCPFDTDKFELNAGMISLSEAQLAGLFVGTDNNDFYLNTGYHYFTITSFSWSVAYNVALHSCILATGNWDGDANVHQSTYQSRYIRPTINLSNTVSFTGTGTYNDPYKVVGTDD